MTAELTTPDGRYLILQGRLWRAQNPALPAAARVRHTRELLHGRRALKAAKLSGDEAAMTAARAVIRDAEVGLGERGAVWWNDGTPDLNRQLAKNSPYAQWFATCASDEAQPKPPAPAPAQPKQQPQGARPA